MLASGTGVPVKDHFRELQVLSLLHGDKWFKYEWPSPVSAMTILSSGKEITSTLAPMPIGGSSSRNGTAGCAAWLWAVSTSPTPRQLQACALSQDKIPCHGSQCATLCKIAMARGFNPPPSSMHQNAAIC